MLLRMSFFCRTFAVAKVCYKTKGTSEALVRRKIWLKREILKRSKLHHQQ